MVHDLARGAEPINRQYEYQGARSHMPDAPVGEGRSEAVRLPMVGSWSVLHIRGTTNVAQKIEDALREHCKINSQMFFLFVITDEGDPAWFSWPNNLPTTDSARQLFDDKKFVRLQTRSQGRYIVRRGISDVVCVSQ